MKTKRRLLLFLSLIITGVYFSSCNSTTETDRSTINFKPRLSEYGLFKSPMADLSPGNGVETVKIASSLFTDYAEKQRLIKVPNGKQVALTGNGLPIFPDGTIIAKSFYYSKAQNAKRRILETRLLILENGKWNAATYQWNAEQTDAGLLKLGAVIPVTFEDNFGKVSEVRYKIPSQKDCGSCHRSGKELMPIGPKARNLNITIDVEGKRQNQLTYFMQKGIFKHADITKINTLPDYNDTSLILAKRARAYLDINCAHCHQPTGIASGTQLILGYDVPFNNTAIDYNKQNILIRMGTLGEFRMPKLGTTIPDDQGVQLIKSYIFNLAMNPDPQ